MKTGYPVLDIMTTEPVHISQDKTIQEAAILMKEHDVGSLIVVKGNDFTGLITEEDFSYKAIAENKPADKTIVKELMTPIEKIISVEPLLDIYDAIKVMNENNVRRLPVISDGKLKGLITRKDILKIEPTLFDITVEKIRLREEERKLNLIDDEIFEEPTTQDDD
ncbi:CBS domain-containing protein [Candidatus Woesearchaeota archaeon]|nr:CBS domain-containing protein [Candidatus Woesearchaeota archaeon]MCF7901178.1 CBS domain-containing protein [Candidatus Woesearchaeota archaeon]MCF8013808.1 CBS domain-containing protein [Candidatus Woesearchaeota archaeon]